MARDPRGRAAYEPTEKDRKTVELMTAAGIEQEAMCKCLGISQDTLAKHYRTELDTAAERANAQVAATLFKRATNPSDPSGVTAAIWWTKTRMKWKETTNLALGGNPDAPPVRLQAVPIPSLPGDNDELQSNAAPGSGKRDSKQLSPRSALRRVS